jgi:hypothetical protein
MSRFVLLSFVVALAACGSASRPASRPSSPAAEAAPAPDSLRAPWLVRGAERPRAQRVDVRAVIESRIDTTIRVDSLSSRAWFEWSENPEASSRRVAGSVRAFALRSGSDSLWRVLDAPTLPVAFVAAVPWAGSAPELLLPRADSCDASTAIAQGWRETWVAPPPMLTVGTAWRDSSETPLCRDGIVLRSVVLRDFVVEGATLRAGQLRVVVRRETRARIQGRGVQFGDSVVFEGEVRGNARLELLPSGAVIADGEGSSELRLTMRGRRRTQELVQRSALVIAIP